MGRLSPGSGARRGLLPLTLAGLLAFVTLLGLGGWQLERRAEKHALLDRIERNLAAPVLGQGDLGGSRRADEVSGAAILPGRGGLFDAAPAGLDYRRVRLEGRFLHQHEMHLVGRARKRGVGVGIVTPLGYDGGAVLVDRGWVPMDRRDPASRPTGNPEGIVIVEGTLRSPSRPGGFTPDNRPARNEWFWPDPQAMGRQAGLGPALVLGLVVVAGPAANPGGLPVGAATRPELTDNHLQYALTWFALALILAIIWGLLVRRRRHP